MGLGEALWAGGRVIRLVLTKAWSQLAYFSKVQQMSLVVSSVT